MQQFLSLEKNERFAVIGMVSGIAGTTLCCGCVPIGIAGIVFSIIALKRLPAENNKRTMALIGLIFGCIGTVLSIGWDIFWFFTGFVGALS